jgi:hypothetical protein
MKVCDGLLLEQWRIKMPHGLRSAVVLVLLLDVAARAQNSAPSDLPSATADQSDHTVSSDSDASGWVRAWTRATEQARSSQPHFVAPIVTTHVMLVQQFRYDISWQQDPSGGTMTSNYGSSRGLEIIPSSRLELGIFPPNYVVHQANVPNGFSDLSYQVKFRAFSATEGHGDYFVGFFFGGTIPTGSVPNGLGHAVLSPTTAAAKGLGSWDIQSTLGATLPISGTDVLGRAILLTPRLTTGSKERSGPCWNRTRHSGWMAP